MGFVRESVVHYLSPEGSLPMCLKIENFYNIQFGLGMNKGIDGSLTFNLMTIR